MRPWILVLVPLMACGSDAAYCRNQVECNDLFPTVEQCRAVHQDAYDWVEQQSGAECRSTYEALIVCQGKTHECVDGNLRFVDNPSSCLQELSQEYSLLGCELPPIGSL